MILTSAHTFNDGYSPLLFKCPRTFAQSCCKLCRRASPLNVNWNNETKAFFYWISQWKINLGIWRLTLSNILALLIFQLTTTSLSWLSVSLTEHKLNLSILKIPFVLETQWSVVIQGAINLQRRIPCS